MQISKILISSDLLRPLVKDHNIEYFHKIRLDKYYYALVYQLQEAVNIPVEKFSFSNTDFDFHAFYSLCGIELKDVYSWFDIYDLENIPQKAIEYYKKYIADSLVIYHEAPNIVKKIHNILDLPYIDLNVHPIRFLDDNFWGILTNKKEIFDRIKKYQIDERSFYIYANLIKSQVKIWDDKNFIEPNSLLFAGQTNIDKSLYSDGRALTIFDYKEQIESFGEKYSKVYYKAHPYNGDLDKIFDFLKQFNFVEIIDENFYKICANENIAAVAAITSGTLYEAKYFGKESIFLGKPYIHLDYDKNCEYSEHTTLSVYNEFLNPVFWADVLQDIVDVKRDVQPIILPHRSNEIRTAFGDYWGQTELDPSFNISKKLVKSVENKLVKTQNEIYCYIDKCYRELQQKIKNKISKFFYREKFGPKRIVHIGPIKISYNKNNKTKETCTRKNFLKIKKDKCYRYMSLFGKTFKFDRKEYRNFKRSLMQVPKFNTLRLELTNLCGYKCVICPRDKMRRKQGITSFSDIDIVIKRIKNKDNINMIELHGHGEPLLVKDLPEKISYLKKHFKNAKILFITTLGYELSDDFLKNVLLSGLSDLRISFYGGNRENYKIIHGADGFDIAYKNLKNVIIWNKELNTNVNIDVRTYHGNSIPNTNQNMPNNNKLMNNIVEELKKIDTNISFGKLKLHNYGEGRNYTTVNNEMICSVGYATGRQILQISYGLNVIPCANAYDDEFIIGNLKEESLEKMFKSKRYRDFQKALLTNNLGDYRCCCNCTKYPLNCIKYSTEDYKCINMYLKEYLKEGM